jgi:hypothetical protein
MLKLLLLKSNKPSFHVLIATIGRPSLQRMLDSLLPQLQDCDHVTIVFDNVNVPKLNIDGAKCQIHIIHQSPKLGFYGHGIRNKYADKLERTNFVMHADDDDIYTMYAFDELRKLCINSSSLYIAKMKGVCGNLIPSRNHIEIGNIGTPCGIIPYDLNLYGIWQPEYGGDGHFYKEIEYKANKILFLDTIIYIVRPDTVL